MKRELTGLWRWIVRIISVAFVLFHLYTAGFGILPLLQQRSIHAGFAIILCLLTMPFMKGDKPGRKVPIWDILLSIFMIFSVINLSINYYNYQAFIGTFSTYEYILAFGTLLLVLEVSRRSQGWVFPILTLLAVFYTLFGPIFPGNWAHAGKGWLSLLEVLYGTQLGMWGYIVGISASIVALFIIFGAILQYTGGGETFIMIANVIAGRLRGGPALVAVVSSALFGMISGTAVANVATTGNFTIPTMKRSGYPPHFAGAVESAASTGGQFTPPIMGAGAFIIAEVLGVSYLKVALAAAIPALLYYVCVFTQVLAEAGRRNLAPMNKEEIPRVRDVVTWRTLAPLFLPVIALFYFLIAGYTVWRAGFWAIILAFIIYLFTDFSLTHMKERLIRIEHSIEQGARSLADLVPLLICANIVVALLNQTGVGVKISSAILAVAGANVILALILSAVVTMILGMGIPTTAAYVIGASVVGVGLIKMGVDPLAAHLFVFYFACISVITPPVCLAAFTAAGIAQASWLKIGFTAMKLAIVAYLVPFVFVYSPALLFEGPLSMVLIMLILRLVGVYLLAVGISGWFASEVNYISRLLLIAAGVLLVLPGLETAYMSVPVFGLAVVIHLLFRKMAKRKMASS